MPTLVETWPLAKEKAAWPLPFLAPRHNPALELRPLDPVHLASYNHLKDPRECRYRQPLPYCLLLRGCDIEVGCVIGAYGLEVEAVASAILIGDRHRAPAGHSRIVKERCKEKANKTGIT